MSTVISGLKINNNYRYYESFRQSFDVVWGDIASGADVVPVTCQDTRKYFSWMRLESALDNMINHLSDYQDTFLNPIHNPGKLLGLNGIIKTDLARLNQSIELMLNDPFIALPSVKHFLKILSDALKPIQQDVDHQRMGGFLPIGVITTLLGVEEIFFLIIGVVLEQIPSVIKEIDEEIHTSEAAIRQYLDVNAVGYDSASIRMALVTDLENMQQAAGNALMLTEPESVRYRLLSAINVAPIKLLQDLQNGIDPSADMAHLLTKLEALDKDIENDFLKGNFLDDLINDCMSEVLGEYAENEEVLPDGLG